MTTPALYDQLWEKRLTKITKNSKLTHVGIDKLESQCAEIAAAAKTHSYTQGQKYGHIADIITQDKYRILISEATWVHAPPADPGSYSTGAMVPGISASLREQEVAEHKRLQIDYANYLIVQEAMKDIIEYAVGNSPIAALKEPYIGYGGSTVKEMFVHLYSKAAVKMTEAEKQDYKESVYKLVWDGTTELSAYFAELTRAEDTLPQRGLTIAAGDKVMAVGAAMWRSAQFTSVQMNGWEIKSTTDKTWAEAQTYFTDKWEEQQHYNKMTAKQTAFQEAALLAKEKEAAEETALLFTIQQDNHDKEMKTMKEALDAMKNEIARLAKSQKENSNKNKENVNPNTGNNTPIITDKGKHKPSVTFTEKPGRKESKSRCQHCNLWGFHLDKDCLELEENKDKRPATWTSKK